MKVIDLDQLRELAKQQFKNYVTGITYESYVKQLESCNMCTYPARLGLADRILFLVKFKGKSYWRAQYVSLRRIT